MKNNNKTMQDMVLKKDKFLPFSTQEFAAITDQLKELHEKKNNDYSGAEYLSNLLAAKRMGLEPWKGVLLRIQDKVSRLETFSLFGNFKVEDEKVEDTLLDLATYSILFLILYRNKK